MGPWSELLDVLEPLDLIMTWGRSSHAPDLATLVVKEAIEGITAGGPSHVRLCLEGERFWEVTWPRCRYGRLAEIDLRSCDLEVGCHRRITEASEEQRRAIVREAERLVGSRYDVAELIEHLLDEAGIDRKDDSDPSRYVCSSGVEHCFRVAGLGFCPGQELVSPEDIRRSPDYLVKWQWGEAPARAGRRGSHA